MYDHPGKLIVALVVVLHAAAPATTHVIADNSRIAGGSDAKDMDTGFVVGLILNDTFGKFFTCGGFIINKQTILTAAHCIKFEPMDVHVGSKNYSLDQGLTLKAAANHTHPKYNLNRNYDYDIALVRLESPLNFSSTIRPIKLVDSGEVLEDDSLATVFGWGTTEFSGHPDKLLYKKVWIVNPETCKKTNSATDRMLCGKTVGLGPGPGDSGGPLVQNDKVIGIVSLVVEPVGRYPAVYARVAALRSWVEKTLAEHYYETL